MHLVDNILIIKSTHDANNIKFANVQRAKSVYKYRNTNDAYVDYRFWACSLLI
jgi:hypothetical protein